MFPGCLATCAFYELNLWFAFDSYIPLHVSFSSTENEDTVMTTVAVQDMAAMIYLVCGYFYGNYANFLCESLVELA